MEKIGVCLRIRPLNQKETAEKDINAWKIVNNKQVQLTSKAQKEMMMAKKNISNYEFDHCFDTHNDNYLIFQQSLKDVVLQCLEGINATVFMYGQTGSGKTFTMLGQKKDELQNKNASALQDFIKQSFQKKEFNDIGILVYSLMEIFKEINKVIEKNRQFELKCSYYEIYNENIFDLLRNQQDFAEPLQIGVDLKNVRQSIDLITQEFIVKGLTQLNVTTLDEVISLIHKGERNRHYAETILNHQSSRSHTLFKFHVSAFFVDEEFEVLRCSTEAAINFIDLAGSEKISNHYQLNEEGKDRIKESQSINKSLFFLTRVIALKTQKVPPTHIPFRNSVLTKLMKSYLTGNYRTVILLCITPTLSQYDQTQSALHFGISAQLIENKVTQNVAYDCQDEGVEIMVEKMRSQEHTIQLQQQTINRLQNQMDTMKNSNNLRSEANSAAQYYDETSTKHTQSVQDVIMDFEGKMMLDKCRQVYKQLTAQQEKNNLLEKQSQDLYKRLMKSNEQILEYYESHKELEELIQQLRMQNQKLQNFAQNALNRLEFYENGSNLGQLANEEIISLQENMTCNLAKIEEEINKRRSFAKIKQNSSEENLKQIMSSEFQKEMENYKDNKSHQDGVVKIPKQQISQNITKKQLPQQSIPKKVKQRHTSPTLRVRQSLKDAKDYISERKDQKNMTTRVKNRSQSSEEKKNPHEEHQLHNDIQSLASRLFNLTEKFSKRKQGQAKLVQSPAKQPQWKKDNKWVLELRNSNNEDIIFETDSELGRDSKSSINESNRKK